MPKPKSARPATLAGREDWRDVPLVTIDPIDARTDDAVFARRDPDLGNNGGFILDVAIADVAALRTAGSALDRKHWRAETRLIFLDRVVPDAAGADFQRPLLAETEQKTRAALAVRMVIGADGRKRSHKFHRIPDALSGEAALRPGAGGYRRPHRRRTDGPHLDDILSRFITAYDALKRARAERDPLDLDLPERKGSC